MGAFHITGLNETVAMLEQSPTRIVQEGFFRAAQAAMNIVADEVERLCPVKPEDTGGILDKGVMRERISIFIELDSRSRGVTAHVGFGTADGVDHVANWVEYGHRIVIPGSGHYYDNRGRLRKGTFNHTYVPPHPFLRPAFEASRDAAVEAFVESLNKTVAKLYPALPAKLA
jgi:HK97 gp10 family phage protein